MSKLPSHRELIEKNDQDLIAFKDDYSKFEKGLFDKQMESIKDIVKNVLELIKDIQTHFKRIVQNLNKVKDALETFVPSSRDQRSKMQDAKLLAIRLENSLLKQ